MTKYTLPAGKYYIGDICYSLDDDIYSNFWGKKKNYKDGKYKVHGRFCSQQNECSSFHRNDEGHYFVVHGTFYGDGYYPTNLDTNYAVDAGVIGMVHESLFDKNNIEKMSNLGSIHTFTGDITFKYNEGMFSIDCESDEFHLEIYTADSPYDSDSSDSD